MQSLSIDRLKIFFETEDRDTAQFAEQASALCLQLIHETWGLPVPEDCRIYILNAAWLKSLFHAAPWPWRFGMGFSLPFWYFRAKSLWQVSAGWAVTFGSRRFIGVKPPRLIQLSDRSIGSRIFVHNDDLRAKVQEVVCHELTHACAAHLRLAPWLNEGLAMYTVDRYIGKSTVRADTLDILADTAGKPGIRSYRQINVKRQAAIISVCVRGYWMTRYLEETQPGALKRVLVQRYSHPEMERELASACGLNPELFWSQVDDRVYSYYKEEGHAPTGKLS
jgi:hypothetical protein